MGRAFGDALDASLQAWSRCEREAKNAAAVMVFDERIYGGLSRARADSEDGEFPRKRNKLFEN